MKNLSQRTLTSLIIVFSSTFVSAKELPLTEVATNDSVQFPWGVETGPNIKIRSNDNPDLSAKFGIRFQGAAQWNDPSGATASSFDFYGRRVRFEAGVQFSKNSSFVMDLRNDNVNKDDTGERSFNIGDAYFARKNIASTTLLNLKFFRGKVDVSRSQTVSSSRLIFQDRASVADEAAQYVNHNRRAMNLQLHGHYKHKLAYSLAIGDGVQSNSFHDALGDNANTISRQGPMVGAKIIVSPIDGWEEDKRSETYFGQGKHASIGFGGFHTGSIHFKPTSTSTESSVDRTLLNLEASGHYLGFFFQAEHFWFLDTVKDFSAATLDVGKSSGWYLTSEYVLTDFYFLAPFVRIERWNRFESDDRYLQKSFVSGLNWYAKGNTMKFGLAVQKDKFGSLITSENDQLVYKITSQFYF